MAKVSGGEKLATALGDIAAKLGNANTVSIGFLENADYPDGKLVAMIAAIQEFGAPRAGIPPRPYFRSMIAKHKGEWPEAISGLLKATDYDAAKTLDQTGQAVAGQLRQSIIDTNAPPLSPVTLMLRKMRKDDPGLIVTGKTVGEAAARVAAGESYAGVSVKPLVDTGHLLGSVDYVVR